MTSIRAMRSAIAVGIVGLLAMWVTTACTSAPSAQARACSARAHLLASLDQLRSCQTVGRGAVCFDYTTTRASSLAADLDSARKGLVGLEAAVPLPQNTALRQLGGVGHIRSLEGEVRALAASVRASE